LMQVAMLFWLLKSKPQQCPRRFLDMIGQLIVSTSNRLHVPIVWFFFINKKNIL
jgi:hypothetical protein